MEGFEREQLDRALERRSVAQGTLMRATIHLVSEGRLLADRRSASGGAAARRGSTPPTGRTTAPRRCRRPRASSEGRLGDGTMSRKEIHELLGSDSVRHQRGEHVARPRPGAALGTWERRRADLYAAAEHWLGAPPKIEEADGIELLVRRYLGAFGPATLAEVGQLGRPASQAGRAGARADQAALASRPRTAPSCSTLPRAPLPDPETPAPVRFLPHLGRDACSLTPAARRSCRRSTGPRSSTPRPRSRCRPSWSTAGSPEPGATRRARSRRSRSASSTPPPGASFARKRTAWRSCTPRSVDRSERAG